MSTVESKLLLSLIDRISGPARKITGVLSDFQRRQSKMMAPLTGLTGRLVAFGGAYVGITEGWSRTYGAAADAQAALSEIGIKAELSQTQLGQLQQRLAGMSPRVNQFTTDLRAGVDTMLTMGLGVDQAMGSIEAIGKASTATGATMTDLSAASVSAMQNLNVLSADIPKMLDGMTSAGNAGAFEMRDMAQYFPQLTASAKSLGIGGVDGILDMAAALQIARRGAGDASSAANNMSNFLGKIMSPEVMKRFKGFGVDVTKELRKAHKQGVSPIEHFIKLVDKSTKGGQADLLGKLFGDKQVLDFVRPMLSDFKDYIRIREDAERASGTVADAYTRRMADANQKMKSFKISIANLGESVGANLLGPISNAAESLAYVFNTLDSRFTIFDEAKARMEGLFSGLGLGDGSSAMTSIRDLIFGAENASAAADKYGRLFGEFREHGRALREFGQAVADNPIVQFLEDLSPYYVDVLKWTIGFALVAGAIRKLAGAMMLLSGATTIIGALKGLKGVYDVFGGGVPDMPGGGNKKKPKSKNGPLDWIEKGRKHSGPTLDILAFEAVRRWGGKALEWGGKGARFGLPALAGYVGYRALDAVPHDAMASATRNDPDLAARLAAEQKRFGGISFEGGRHRVGLGAGPAAGDKPLSLDSGTIGQLLQPMRGVQEVRVTNREQRPINVHNVFNITEAANGQGTASQAMGQMGEAIKAAVEAADTDF